MPYYLVIVRQDGVEDFGPPIVCDNPESIHGYEDKSIKRKVENLALRIKHQPTVVNAYCVHKDSN